MNAVAVLPPFGHVAVHRAPVADGPAQEAAWLAEAAASGRAAAHLWQATEGLVVPRSLTHGAAWPEAGAAGVRVRASGGGIVPQGPGVWNLSLVWPAPAARPEGTDAVYRALCDGLIAAFARLGIAAAPQAVEGSWCDGRWNLAAGGRKFVGTAQAWRRIGGRPMVLAHAVIVSSADPAALTDRANALEVMLGQPPRYRADALTSVARAAGLPPGPPLDERVAMLVAEQFARVVPPRPQMETSHGVA